MTTMQGKRTTARRDIRDFRRRTDTRSEAAGADAQLREVLETAALGVFEYYPLSGVVRVNTAVRGHFGLSPDAVFNYNVFLVGLHPADRDSVVRELQQAMDRNGGGRFSAEFRTTGIEDGRERHIVMEGRAFFNQWGEAARFVAATRDISDRRQHRALQRRREDPFRRVLDNVNEGILLHAPDGSIVDMNERFLEMYRVGRDELRAMSITDISAEDNPVRDLPRIWSRVMAGEKQIFEWKARRPGDGTTFDVEVFLNRVDMDDERLILATVRDISDRKRLEEALTKSEVRYKLLFDKSPLPKWVVDLRTFKLLEANEAAIVLYGYSRGEFLQLGLAEIRTPEEFERISWRARTCCNSGERFEGQVQTRHRKKTGEVIDVDVRYTEIDYKGRRAGLGVIIDITERKRIEEELGQAREAYRLLVEHQTDMVARLSPEGKRLYVNPAFLEFIGKTEEEVMNTDYTPELHPEDLPRAAQDWEKTFRPPEYRSQIEARTMTRSGWRWASWRNTAVLDEHGEPTAAICVGRDVTELKQAEEALRSSEERFRSVIENLSEGLMLFDPDGNLIYQNPASLRIHGFGLEGEGRLSHQELPTTWKAWDQTGRAIKFDEWPVSRVFRHERFQNQVLRVVRVETDQEFYGSYNGSPIYDEEGKQALGFITIRDITEQVRAQAELAARERRLRTLFDSGIIGIIYWNMKGEIVDANDKFLEIVGYTRLDLREGRINWAAMTPPEYRALDEHAVEELRATGIDTPYEKEFVRKDNTRVLVMIGAAMFDEPRINGVAYVLDIMDRKRTEERLKRTVEELQRSNSELQQFAYVSSHDLQEPLRTVASYAELLSLKYKGKLDENADRYIAYAVEGANRMSALINDLLTYSRVGTQGSKFVPVDMNDVYQQAMDGLSRAIRESQAVISADSLPVVEGDETQLRQLVLNLLANAIRFRKAGVAPEVRVSAFREGPRYVFSIADNGIGIEPRFFERIFVIFQRLHTREEYPGTGVGLAICKRIVERHGGRIWVESKPGEGSTFFFTLRAA